MTKIDLVFRRIDERTADVSLELAKRHIRPDNIYIMDDVRPFTRCVEEMLKIEHDCDYVVYLDADCLILEDMRSFIEDCDASYVDAYVSDRFRGRIHCGVHVTRIDLVRAMARVEPPVDDLKYALRPESRLRNLAMKPLRLSKQFRNFDILHDHFRAYRHIFQKYALRELRSRTSVQFRRLSSAMARWRADEEADLDLQVAAAAVEYARRHVPRRRALPKCTPSFPHCPCTPKRRLRSLALPKSPSSPWPILRHGLPPMITARSTGQRATVPRYSVLACRVPARVHLPGAADAGLGLQPLPDRRGYLYRVGQRAVRSDPAEIS